MRGRPPKKALTPEQERAASAFVGGAEAPTSGSGRGPEADSAASQTVASQTAPEASPSKPKPARASRPVGEGEAERPWEAAFVREDVVKGYALRLPEPLYLKMKWVASERGQSMNELCREAIEGVVEDHLRASGAG